MQHLIRIEKHDFPRLHKDGHHMAPNDLLDVLQHLGLNRHQVSIEDIRRRNVWEGGRSALLQVTRLRVQARKECRLAGERMSIDGRLGLLEDLEGVAALRPSQLQVQGDGGSKHERNHRLEHSCQDVAQRTCATQAASRHGSDAHRQQAPPQPFEHIGGQVGEYRAAVGHEELAPALGALEASEGSERRRAFVGNVVVKADERFRQPLRIYRLVHPVVSAQQRADADARERVRASLQRQGLAEAPEARLRLRQLEAPKVKRTALHQRPQALVGIPLQPLIFFLCGRRHSRAHWLEESS
mmetsp:Transcript_18389/g.64594  ORF Transcript_18389/g.64594 Transcript_18389/m.64594 type:complete len:298 (+) Transcript_18389:459-1352(+)